MPQHETYTPESLDEVSALLLAAESGTPSLAGGSILLTCASSSEPTSIVVDLGRVPELNRLEYDERNGLLIGAVVPLADALRLPTLRHAYAILADSFGRMDEDPTRGRVTIAACLSRAEPGVEIVVPLICLGACIAIFGPHGWSETSVEALCARTDGTMLQPGEFVVGARCPGPAARSGGAYVCAVHGAAEQGAAGALLLMQDDLMTCCGARVAVCAAQGQPLRAPDAERFLHGRRLEPWGIEEAGRLAAEAWPLVSPESEGAYRPALQSAAAQAIQRALERVRS